MMHAMHHPLGCCSGQLIYRDGCRVNSEQKAKAEGRNETERNEATRRTWYIVGTHVGVGMCIIDNCSGSL